MNIELLSPAKNLACGIAAINHGADAVYIGASQFGARASAGNSLADIEALALYAHQYRAKVFVAFNTLLTNDQLPEAEKLIHDIYNAGADALIVQDMGILKMDLPPIALHASTQTDNRTPQKVKFLQDVGFSRVVLARELSIQQISEISTKTNVELEAFVYGALCVSYSGQCYISQAMCGRSANRGECAQYCRLPYNLIDANGRIIEKNKHLLSLKDLDLSDHLAQMAQAGVLSFKIEGRMKDEHYVKNVTAHFRKKLDALMHSNTNYRATSVGKTRFFFTPMPEKTFRRPATNFFINGRQNNIITPDSPKSTGEKLGVVHQLAAKSFDIVCSQSINNGDGLCFVDSKGVFSGFRANSVQIIDNDFKGSHALLMRVFVNEMPQIQRNTVLFRNHDQAFEKSLNAKTSDRRVALTMNFEETENGFSLSVCDEENICATLCFEVEKQLALKPDMVFDNIRQQLSKLGNTIFEVAHFEHQLSAPFFFSASQLGEWKRATIEALEQKRAQVYVREQPVKAIPSIYPEKNLSYLGNVSNLLAHAFYTEHGVQQIAPAFEIKAEKDVPLMFSKHCIKFDMGHCPRQGKISTLAEPLLLENNGKIFRLDFDCKQCIMTVSLDSKNLIAKVE